MVKKQQNCYQSQMHIQPSKFSNYMPLLKGKKYKKSWITSRKIAHSSLLLRNRSNKGVASILMTSKHVIIDIDCPVICLFFSSPCCLLVSSFSFFPFLFFFFWWGWGRGGGGKSGVHHIHISSRSMQTGRKKDPQISTQKYNNIHIYILKKRQKERDN